MENFKEKNIVSIAITSFNYGHYISEAVQSIINQTSSDWRLMIYDNGSTDNTFEILKPYLQDERITLIIHDENIGARNNSVFAVRNAETSFFSILQADDFLEETFVENALWQFKNHAECPFVFFDWHQYMDDTKKRLYHNRFPFDKDRVGITRISPYLTVCNFVPLHMAVFRTDALKYAFELLLKSPFNQVGEQYILKLMEDKYGSGCYSGTLGGVWRRHSQQITALQMDSGVAHIEEPIERHWYATMAPNPDKVNVFLSLINFVRLCSHVDYFTAAKWLIIGEGVRYTESFNISLSTPERKRLEGIALTVAVKYTAHSIMNLCSAEDVKEWLKLMEYAPTKNGLKQALEVVWSQEGDEFINEKEIKTVCKKFFLLDVPKNSYFHWRQTHILNEADKTLLTERLDNALVQPEFLLITVLESNEIKQLADLIESLGNQLYCQWSFVILSAVPCPDPIIDELEMVHWIQSDGDLYTAINQVIESADAFDWVAVVPSNLVLNEKSLSVTANYINIKPDWCFIYSDQDSVDSYKENINPLFKPDFNLDLLRSSPYIGEFCWVKKATINELGGYCCLAGMLNWDLALKVFEQKGDSGIGHIPEILSHLSERIVSEPEKQYLFAAGKLTLQRHFERLGINAGIAEGLMPGTFFIDYPLVSMPLVSIVITIISKDQLGKLKDCVESIIDNTEYGNFEIIVTSMLTESKVNDAIVQIRTDPIKIRYVAFDGDVHSPLTNRAIHLLDSEFILLFSPDLLVMHSNWLESLMAQALRDDVGIVGARIVDGEKKVHHAGMILGMGDFGVADYPNRNLLMNNPGYMNRAAVVQNYSAVSVLCFLVKKALLDNLFMEEGSVFDHIDFCLRVKQKGLSIIWTPYVTLMLKQQVLQEQTKEKLRKDADHIIHKWLPQLANDPAYNRNLSLKHRHFQVETETDVTWNIDFHDRLRIYAFPANDSGVGEYRVRAPLRALTNASMIQSSLLPNHSATLIPDIVEIERVKPDVLLLQNGTADYLIHAWEQYKRFNSVFRIYSQDDLVFALPGKHPLQGKWPKDMRKRLRKLMESSDRLIVANETLKEAYSRWIDDIKIVPNFLESTRWVDLSVTKKQRIGNKLRVGWAGGAQHHGDLEFIVPVVESLKDEVDWVFMGMCPDRLKPIIKEYHAGVPFDLYPQKLAELDLDLAIAPLEYNNFNTAKTNLRILEYGVLGWPVVCSDILPYQNAPVTLVGNNNQYWLKAIREKIGEPEALRAEGKVLQQWVLDNYLLEDHLDDWLQALTP